MTLTDVERQELAGRPTASTALSWLPCGYTSSRTVSSILLQANIIIAILMLDSRDGRTRCLTSPSRRTDTGSLLSLGCRVELDVRVVPVSRSAVSHTPRRAGHAPYAMHPILQRAWRNQDGVFPSAWHPPSAKTAEISRRPLLAISDSVASEGP